MKNSKLKRSLWVGAGCRFHSSRSVQIVTKFGISKFVNKRNDRKTLE